jgi:hypothetical protein
VHSKPQQGSIRFRQEEANKRITVDRVLATVSGVDHSGQSVGHGGQSVDHGEQSVDHGGQSVDRGGKSVVTGSIPALSAACV